MMKSKTEWCLSSAFAAISIFGAGATATAAVSATKVADQSTQIQELVVTATRREEKLQNVPIAVQAFSGDTLAKLGITNFQDLLLNLPDVHAAGRGPGQNSVYIRGLSTDTASILIAGAAGTNPNVAIYLDDVVVSLPARNLDIYAADLQRIEVLKGPQGTLFGASAMGGAVRYITNKPNLKDFQAGVNASYKITKHGDPSVGVNGYINIPVIADKFAIRMTAYSDNQGGYINNVAGTYQMPLTSPGLHYNTQLTDSSGNFDPVATAARQAVLASIPRPVVDNGSLVKNHFNTADYRGFRIAGTYQINNDWSVEAQHLTQVLHTEGVFDYDPTLGDLNVQRYNRDSLYDRGDLTAWTVNGRLGMLSVLYTGGYVTRTAEQRTDYTKYSSSGPFSVYYNCDYSIYSYANQYKATLPATAACHNPKNHVFNKTRNTRFTQEIRLSTPSDKRLRGILGGYYDSDHVYDQDWFAYEGSVDSGFPGPNGPLVNAPPPNQAVAITANDRNITDQTVQFINDITRSDRQLAVFGEASFDIIPDKLTLTAGGRYYNQRVSIAGGASFGSRFSQSADHGRPTQCDPVLLPQFCPVTESGFIPKVNLTFKPRPGILAYITYSQGFRPGGFNRGGGKPTGGGTFFVPAFYGTDSVKNYEAGWKTRWLNNTLQIDGAAYYIKWDNLQSQVYRPKDSFLTFVQNAANAEIKGVETDVIWRGISGLTVSANAVYTHSALTKILPGIANFRPVGSQLALTPEVQGNVTFRYEKDVSEGVKGYAQMTVQAAGRMLSTLDRGADPVTGAPLGGDYHLKAYQTLNLSIGVSKDKWNIEVFGENVTDTRAQLYANASDRTLRITTNRPATVGVRFSAKY